MRLGQVHRRRPLARDELRQPRRLLLGAAVLVDGVVGAVGQAPVHVQRHVRRRVHGPDRGVEQVRHALAAVVGVEVDADPAARRHRVVGRLEALGRAHHAVLQPAALAVADGVQRRQHLGRDLARLLQHRAGGVAVELVIAGDRHLADPQHVVQHEVEVAQRRGVGGHGGLPDPGVAVIRRRRAARAGRGSARSRRAAASGRRSRRSARRAAPPSRPAARGRSRSCARAG